MNYRTSMEAEEEIASGELMPMSSQQEQIGLRDKTPTLVECIELSPDWLEGMKFRIIGGPQQD